MRLDVGRDSLAAGLFLAFDDQLHVHGELRPRLQIGADRGRQREELALVVGGAAGVEASVAHGRFERRARPQVERIRGLHVVVTVPEHGGPSGGAHPLGVHERVPRDGNDLDGHPDLLEVVRDPVGGVLGVLAVRREGPDARDAEQVGQLLFELRAVRLGELDRGGHGPPPRGTVRREGSRRPGACSCCGHEAASARAIMNGVGGVAQVVRARGSYPRCRGFEALRRHHFSPAHHSRPAPARMSRPRIVGCTRRASRS